MSLQRQLTTLAAIAACFAAHALPAHAAIRTGSFTGVLGAVDPALSSQFTAGDLLSGTWSFDDAVAARVGSTSNFAVFDALTNLAFTLGSYSASSSGAPEIQVDNDPGLPFHDRYAVLSRASDGLTGASVGGLDLSSFFVRADDTTDSVFSDATVIPTSLSLAQFDDNRIFGLFFTDPNDSENVVFIEGRLTSLDLPAREQIPEPSTVAIWSILGAVVLAGRFTRRRLQRA